MEGRVYNFAAGPAAISGEVLETAKHDLLDWNNSGMSVMELSHRSKEFDHIIKKAEADLRSLLEIPSNYKVLFIQGGGSSVFSIVPMNLLGAKDAKADYLVTGSWSEKAAKEAQKYSKNINIISTKSSSGYVKVPNPEEIVPSEGSSYFYYCANETVDGVEFQFTPDVKVPLICDMSSNILSRHVDVSKYGMIYAGAQKNIGPSGVTVVIVREDLLGKQFDYTPVMMDLKVQADNNSLYNTPPTYAIYMSGLVFDWMIKKGGVSAFEAMATKKSQMLYDLIDSSNGFYSCPVEKGCRSRMNVVFRIVNPKTGQKDPALEKTFVEEAEKRRMHQLAGHRSVGGIRASLYNAVAEEAVQALVLFMTHFITHH